MEKKFITLTFVLLEWTNVKYKCATQIAYRTSWLIAMVTFYYMSPFVRYFSRCEHVFDVNCNVSLSVTIYAIFNVHDIDLDIDSEKMESNVNYSTQSAHDILFDTIK